MEQKEFVGVHSKDRHLKRQKKWRPDKKGSYSSHACHLSQPRAVRILRPSRRWNLQSDGPAC